MDTLISILALIAMALGLYGMVLASLKGMRDGNDRVNRLTD